MDFRVLAPPAALTLLYQAQKSLSLTRICACFDFFSFDSLSHFGPFSLRYSLSQVESFPLYFCFWVMMMITFVNNSSLSTGSQFPEDWELNRPVRSGSGLVNYRFGCSILYITKFKTHEYSTSNIVSLKGTCRIYSIFHGKTKSKLLLVRLGLANIFLFL